MHEPVSIGSLLDLVERVVVRDKATIESRWRVVTYLGISYAAMYKYPYCFLRGKLPGRQLDSLAAALQLEVSLGRTLLYLAPACGELNLNWKSRNLLNFRKCSSVLLSKHCEQSRDDWHDEPLGVAELDSKYY